MLITLELTMDEADLVQRALEEVEAGTRISQHETRWGSDERRARAAAKADALATIGYRLSHSLPEEAARGPMYTRQRLRWEREQLTALRTIVMTIYSPLPLNHRYVLAGDVEVAP